MGSRMAEFSIRDILRRVVGQRREIKLGVSRLAEATDRPISKPLFDYFFTTQIAIEDEGSMDYHKYSKRLWQDLVLGEQAEGFESDPAFKNFEGNLILGLQNIDMRKYGYPDLVDNLGELIARYGDNIASVAIWSQGDEQATGYQDAKIARSGIMGAFLRAVRGRDENSAREFIKRKTGHLVSDDKFKSLNEFLQNHPEATRIVVIEDSRQNLQKAAQLVATLNTSRPKDSQIEYIPIWATYSREGIDATKKAALEGNTKQLEREKFSLNALKSPKDLLDQQKFGPIFNNAHLLVDFDGVIGDNISMRKAQARVKYNALISSVRALRGVLTDEADKIIMDNLQRKQVRL